MFILFDHGTPKGLIRALPGHTVGTPGKVLLIAYASIGREQKINRRFLGGIEQRAVGELIPSSGLCRNDDFRRVFKTTLSHEKGIRLYSSSPPVPPRGSR
jgi:hypothetical protein